MDIERLRDRILSHVESKLIDEGHTHFSVDEIATALGMSKKTFYRGFPTKDAMFEELITRILKENARGIDGIMAGPGTFVDKVVALMGFLGTVVRRFAVPLSEDVRRRLPGIWERVEAFRQRKIQETFWRLLEQGRAEGYVLHEVEPALFLMALRAAIREIVQPGVLAAHAFSVPDVLGQILRIFFSGVLTENGRAAFSEVQRRQRSHSH